MVSGDAGDSFQSVACFLSYARADDRTFNGISTEVKTRLTGMYEARTGRTLKVFLDRDDIGWGQDWRESINSAVLSATVFIPLITMKYIARPQCREEFMAFYQSASLLGVTDLLLPIVVSGASHITRDHPREEVRIVERLNYENVESAVIEGFASPQWMRAMSTITNKLIAAIDRAESHLAKAPHVPAPDIDDPAVLESQPFSSHVGLVDLMDGVAKSATLLTHNLMPKAERDISTFAGILAAELEPLGSSPTPASISKRARSMARRLEKPAKALEASSAAVRSEVDKVDAAIRLVVDMAPSIEGPKLRDDISRMLKSVGREGFDRGAYPTLVQVIEDIAIAQTISVPLRMTLEPAHRGLVTIRDAFEIVRSWQDLATDLNS